jgi:hypothetical protein
MTKQKVVHGMRRLEKAFNKQYSEGQIEIWIEKFTPWREIDFYRHTEACIEKCTFLPTIADVYKQRQESIIQPRIEDYLSGTPHSDPKVAAMIHETAQHMGGK